MFYHRQKAGSKQAHHANNIDSDSQLLQFRITIGLLTSRITGVIRWCVCRDCTHSLLILNDI